MKMTLGAPRFRESLEPDAKELRDIRHALEHRYLKLSHEWWSGFKAVRSELHSRLGPDTTRPEALDELDDNLALYQYRSEFDAKALRMFQMVRAALIYLCLAIHWEEGRRHRERERICQFRLWRRQSSATTSSFSGSATALNDPHEV